MANGHLTVRRRNVHERRVLLLLRGDIAGVGREGADRFDRAERYRADFARLRELACRNGLKVQSLDAQYVAASELRILRWLAEAQRELGLRSCAMCDVGLKASIRQCAESLKELGAFLPTQTLYL